MGVCQIKVRLRYLLYVFIRVTNSDQIKIKPEDHWSSIAHLSAEDMLKSAVIEGKKFKHRPRVGADNPFGPNF